MLGGVRSTPADRTRDQLQAIATTGLDTPTFVAATLEFLARAVPFAAACVATIDPATRLATSAIKSGTMSPVGAEEDALWAFHEYVADDLYDYRDLLSRDGAVMTTHGETGGDPNRSPRFEHFFAPTWSVTDELRSAATAEGDLWAFVALFRDDSGRTRQFNAAEMEFVSSVAPTLARGIRASLVASTAAALDGCAAGGPGVLLVDDAGNVLSANAEAAERIAALGGGPLGATALPMSVQSVVKAARRFGRGQETWAPRIRVPTRTGRWVVVSASPLTTFGAGGPSTTAVTIEDAGAGDVLPLVVAAFGLTPREQEVVRLVLRGVSTAEIGKELHVSAYTVQDHLKSVFDKVNVRSRRELAARVFVEEYVPRMASGRPLGAGGFFV